MITPVNGGILEKQRNIARTVLAWRARCILATNGESSLSERAKDHKVEHLAARGTIAGVD
jgi:hypothetical protein